MMIQNIYSFWLGGALLGLGLLILVLSLHWLSADEFARRLHEFVQEPSEEPRAWEATLSVRKRELSGSFANRTLLPWFRAFGRLLGRLTPARTLQDLSHQLMIAGNPLGLKAREYYGLRMAFLLLGFWLIYITLKPDITNTRLLISVVVLYIAGYFPKIWLRSRVRARQNRIHKGLPDALDMLSVCADAGLGFDQSMQRVSEYWQTPVGIEFGRVVKEMEMGLSRQDALRSLAERLDITELSSFVAVIIQSDQLGMSIADTLHAQAKQMREERRFRAQEQARKIPLKMLFPMMTMIFPAMMAVIIGPAWPAINQFFENIANGSFG
jgi:tight adherence protein C